MLKTSICKECGKELKYRTKKPNKCKKCAKNIKYKSKDKDGSRSNLEFKVQSWLNEIFPEPDYHYIANGYYSWIKSPKNYPLQLDFLIYSKSKTLFAIEIQGPQHYSKAYYQSQQEFDYLMDCDIIKKRILKKKNIQLLILDYNLNMTKEEFLKLIENNITLV